MLGNCEKMTVISSSTSIEWPQPQNNEIDEKGLMDHSSAAAKTMEKPNQDQHQQQQQPPLKCPRCDSLNTKFCYYNNYSLSQPRHFCKACKRYWTRGGTLRNVPVGGGCRKNKRVKRPASTNEVTSSSAQTSTSNPSHVVPSGCQIDLSSSSSAANHINPLFYSLLTSNNHHPSELNLSYQARLNSSNGYDLLQSQMNDMGLGFSSGLLVSDVNGSECRNGINSISSNKQSQDVVVPSNPLLSSYSNPVFGSTSTSTTSTMASLIASSLQQQQKMIFGGGFEGFDSMQVQPPRNSEGSLIVKDVKMEEGQHRLDWSVAHNQNHIDQITSSDPSLFWNTTGVGAWLDPSNVGSSVPSLI